MLRFERYYNRFTDIFSKTTCTLIYTSLVKLVLVYQLLYLKLINELVFAVSNLFAFAPTLLICHCLFIFLFKKWLGPMGTFYATCLSFSLTIFLNTHELLNILQTGNYYYLDFGRWFYCLDLIDSHLIFCIDSLALIASLLVLVLTLFALYFGVEYMYREAFINRLLYLLNLFATSVIFLFFCYDYFLIIFAWECIGLFSFLLVNFYSTRIYTIKAALKTFVFSRISDMFMFISFTLALIMYNSTDLSLIFIQTPFLMFHYLFIGSWAVHFLTMFSLTLALSGGIKAAQFFSHVWLPDAMEAPTPASALIHSSTLVVAGVFLIIRFSIIFEFTIITNYLLVIIGALTLSFGSVTATFQQDIKKLVAYSTISQIGYLVCGCGFCCYEEVLLYLIIHALNKAFLFVLVGYTVHFFSGNTDLRQMGGMYTYSFDLSVLFFGICLNLAGMPYSAGFIGKEMLLFQILRDDFISLLVRGCWLVSFFFTPIYMLMLVFLVIFGPKKSNINIYKWYWDMNNHDYLFLNKTYYSQTINFQITAVTSRLTVYILFSFWCWILFFGNTLISVLLNFSTLTEAIPSSAFVTIKQHSFFMLTTTTAFLSKSILFYILILTTWAVVFLLNFRYSFTYTYFETTTHLLTFLICASILFTVVILLI